MREYNSRFNNIPPGWSICGCFVVPPDLFLKQKFCIIRTNGKLFYGKRRNIEID